MRAEVAREDEALDRNARHLLLRLGFDEDAHLGFAKAIDRLHRVADGEQRMPVAGLPSRGEQAQKLELRERCVLEFVDQQMIDPKIEREQQVGRPFLAAEGGERAQHALREIERAGVAKGEGQAGGEARQQIEQRHDDGPRLFRIARRRQPARRVERLCETRHRRQFRKDRFHRGNARRVVRTARSRFRRGKAVALVDRLPELRLGRDQEPRCERAPGVKCTDRRRRKAASIGTRHQPGRDLLHPRCAVGVLHGVAQKMLQRARKMRRERRGDRRQLAFDLARERCFQLRAEGLAPPPLQESEPLIALAEHAGKRRHHRTGIVVEMFENPSPVGIVRIRVRKTLAHRGFVEWLRAFDEARRSSEAGGKRRLSREARAERIDRLHREARRMRRQVPPVSLVLREDVPREPLRQPFMRRFRLDGTARVGERAQDPVAHFAGGLPRECHRYDALRAVDVGEQREEALDQELRLAGARRRLDQERAPDVERAGARVAVVREGPEIHVAVTHRHRLRDPRWPARRSGRAPGGGNARRFPSCRAEPRPRRRR